MYDLYYMNVRKKDFYYKHIWHHHISLSHSKYISDSKKPKYIKIDNVFVVHT